MPAERPRKRVAGSRARCVYAFRTLRDARVTLSFRSDWPGTNASWCPASSVLGIYAAVTRQTLEGKPQEGWYPEKLKVTLTVVGGEIVYEGEG